MRVIKPAVQIVNGKSAMDMYRSLEKAGRVCWQTGDRITDNSCEPFVRRLIEIGHHSVLEHESVSVLWVTDRGVLAEITRHRVGVAFSVSSTRYIRYLDDNAFEVIMPSGLANNAEGKGKWQLAMWRAEEAYYELLKSGAEPQTARSVLPQSFACRIRLTANIREWRHILDLRASKAAHPDMREIAMTTLKIFTSKYPVLFGDIWEKRRGND
jgi:thymidylate synthase (FAD)